MRNSAEVNRKPVFHDFSSLEARVIAWQAREEKIERTLKLIVALAVSGDYGSDDWCTDLAVTAADAQEILEDL